ncbi:MAG TPA: hypothetical protein VME46_07185 [Acidimicrobiales bacterium]|nr:hypothetical protein [Acidimicrobiales bacterium]
MTNHAKVALAQPAPAGGSSPGLPEDGDLHMNDWLAAQQRHSQPASASAAAPPGAARSTRVSPLPRPAWERRQRLLKFARAWAVVKMSISAVSTWLTMASIKASAGEMVVAYGVVCFWWAVGPHWRKRCFGPGQQMEPELYEVVAAWCWRVGVVLVLAGGLLYFAGR